MLRTGLIHPEILGVLGAAGHGSLVLVSDANFPSLTVPNQNARRVFLNLRPGLVSVTDILAALASVLEIERVVLMDPDEGASAPVHSELVEMVEPATEIGHLSRHAFYDATRSGDVALVVVSGDQRWYANVLLTIGSVPERSRIAASATSAVSG